MATSPFPSIDRVRVETDERLDRPDFEGVLALADEGSQRQLGALLGYGGGVTSPPRVSFDLTSSTKTMRLGPFQYYVCAPGWTDPDGTQKGWFGAFATFDPSSGFSQMFAGDFNAVYVAANSNPSSAAAKPILYVRPRTIDTDLDARRKFVGSSDTPVSMRTRSRITHEFKWAAVNPDHSSVVGWAPVLLIQSWSGTAGAPGIPVIRYLSFLNNQQIPEKNGQPLLGTVTAIGGWLGAADEVTSLVDSLELVENHSPIFQQGGKAEDFGLLQQLGLLRYRLSALLSSDDTGPAGVKWWSLPTGTDGTVKGLKQIIDDSASSSAPQVTITGKVHWNGAAYIQGVTDHPTGWTVTTLAVPGDVDGMPGPWAKITISPTGTDTYYMLSLIATPNWRISPLDDAFARTTMTHMASPEAPYPVYVKQFSLASATSVEGSFFFTAIMRKV